MLLLVVRGQSACISRAASAFAGRQAFFLSDCDSDPLLNGNGILGKWLGKSHILEQLQTNVRWSLNTWGDGMTKKVAWTIVKEYADRVAEDERSAS